MAEREGGKANPGNRFTGMSASPLKENGSDKTRESLPILGSPPASGTAKKDRAPKKYTEHRETVEEKLGKMTAQREITGTEQGQVRDSCQDSSPSF